eukprot:TRINITY_DN45339_c0_g1_i1.p2 TRINITY_DN45339_c0_g1~~TRINITY_DN45339_c0_g1_i1.p2  ORF type:complete len:271 (-),score=83.48 TRINITY_DN45339_c0_g1_i1:449-1261(-)
MAVGTGKERMIDVGEIRFTQEHVYDSFNSNSDRANLNVVGLIEAILAGEKTPRDLPLIRVAVKQGAYWCVDNRRLFVYKHCKLGQIPVEVHDWKDTREFELKWKNGLLTRGSTGGGRRAGVITRTDTPFPRSVAMEPSLSSITCWLPPDEQEQHDKAIEALSKKRRLAEEKEAAQGDDGTADLKKLLMSATGTDKKKKKGKAGAKKRKLRDAQDEEKADEAPAVVKKKKKGKAAAKKTKGKSEAPASKAISVALEDSDGSEDFAVEIKAM